MKSLITLLLTLAFGVTIAQNKKALEKIEAAKIALISKRLELSPEQAEKFWPLYNQYTKQRKEARSEFDIARKQFDAENATEEEYKRLLDIGQKVKERQLGLEQQYSDRLLKVISNRQMLNLRKAEGDFRRMLLERMREQGTQRDRMDRNRELQQQRNQKRNNN